jgi:hypothetical protein
MPHVVDQVEIPAGALFTGAAKAICRELLPPKPCPANGRPIWPDSISNNSADIDCQVWPCTCWIYGSRGIHMADVVLNFSNTTLI